MEKLVKTHERAREMINILLSPIWASVPVALLALSVAAAKSEVREFPSEGLEEVKVENTSGRVSIVALSGSARGGGRRGGQSNKTIVSAIKTQFSDQCSMNIERVGNTLYVKVEKSTFFSFENCEVNFEIKTPKSVNLNLSNGSGDLKINGIHGRLEFSTGSGQVLADGEFLDFNGKSGSGDVSLNGLLGGGQLRTGSGDIHLTFANTSAGMAPKGVLDIKSGSGDAILLFPKGTLIKTNYEGGSGKISNEIGESARAGFVVSMQTGSGDLKIKTQRVK